MKYIASLLREDITVKKIYSIHYFEYSKDYKFVGERHNFWEFVYVDKGEINVVADDKTFVLSQGDVIFHKPNEWHNVLSNNIIASNVAIMSFECNSDAMRYFENKIIKCGQYQKELISKIITEYTHAYKTPLNRVFCYKMDKKKNQFFGSEQLIKNYICEFLISFIRNDYSPRQYTLVNKNNTSTALNVMLHYMENNINKSISISDLGNCASLNRTAVNKIFKDNFNMGAIEYFIFLKTELAKRYLREDNYNITQISELLGYTTVHYFSRQFKKVTGMSPVEYSKSIKALI